MPVLRAQLSCSKPALSGVLQAARRELACTLIGSGRIEARMHCVTGLSGTLSVAETAAMRTSEYNRIRR